MKLFKNKKWDGNPFGKANRLWWERIKMLYFKDTGKTTDPDDPEYNAQAIYQHWIKSYLLK